MQRWLGYLRGSRTGTLFLVQAESGESTLTIGFSGGEDVTLNVDRVENSTSATLTLNGQRFGTAIVESETDRQISGSWAFVNGAQGVFELSLHATEQTPAGTIDAKSVWTREVPIGAVTLYRPDLERLIAEMQGLIERPSISVVRAKEGGNVIAEQTGNYLARKDYVSVVREMTIAVDEITSAPLKRMAHLILNDDGSSRMFISSTEEIWTTAATIRLESFLGQFSSKITGWLRRRGLTINTFILIAILIWMPDRPLIQRVVVFLLGVALIALISKSHSMLPYNRVISTPIRNVNLLPKRYLQSLWQPWPQRLRVRYLASLKS